MDMLKLVFLAFVLSGHYYEGTMAMGICRFAREFPSKVNWTSLFLKDPAGGKQKVASSGEITTVQSICPLVEVNCTICQGTCRNPNGCPSSNCTKLETCRCNDGFLLKGGECVPEDECGCFIEGEGVLPEGGKYTNENCSEQCVCEEGLLTCNNTCDTNAECRAKNGVRNCYCNDGFKGDGQTCTALPKDCYEAYQTGHRQNGVYTILPKGWPGSAFEVFCDMNRGGWTLFQRRKDGVTNFYRGWEDYKHGFGSVKQGKDFWLGNEKLYYLTKQNTYKLRVDIVASGGAAKHALYDSFRIGNEGSNYRLNIAESTSGGNGGNGFKYSNGKSFSTHDNDHDACGKHNCAQRHRGAWWYNARTCQQCQTTAFCSRFHITSNCKNVCTRANLNGDYKGGNGKNIFWDYYQNCNLRSAEMKIRPSNP